MLNSKAVAFSANGEYILSTDDMGVRVRRIEDGEEIAKLKAEKVVCLAVSRDGKWIAAGTYDGDLILWDAVTYEQVFTHTEATDVDNCDGYYTHVTYGDICGVDFSPNSTHLVSASCDGPFNDTTGVWDLATCRQVLRLDHGKGVSTRVARYSLQGDRIATATRKSLRVWDSSDGRLLVNVNIELTPNYNSGLLWFNDNLFVVSKSEIKEFDASTGSPVTEWSVPDSDGSSCIILPKHNRFIAYSANDTVTFWDPSTHTQLGFIQHHQLIRAITLSPCQQFLAICCEDGETSIESLFVSIMSHRIMAYLSLAPPVT